MSFDLSVLNPDALIPATVFAAFFLWGVRSTWWIWHTYRAIAPTLQPNRRAIGRAFVVVAFAITVIAGWLGFISVRRLFGLDPLDWSPAIGYALAVPVLALPAYLKRTWSRIGQNGPKADVTRQPEET